MCRGFGKLSQSEQLFKESRWTSAGIFQQTSNSDAPVRRENQSRYFVLSSTNDSHCISMLHKYTSHSFSRVSMIAAMKCYSQQINISYLKQLGPLDTQRKVTLIHVQDGALVGCLSLTFWSISSHTSSMRFKSVDCTGQDISWRGWISSLLLMYLWQNLLECFGLLSCMSTNPWVTSHVPDGNTWCCSMLW